MDFASLITPAALTALVEILLIDIVLAGDNAIVLPPGCLRISARRSSPSASRRRWCCGSSLRCSFRNCSRSSD
jgi:hypothetical protein